jgi:hypothetical protein
MGWRRKPRPTTTTTITTTVGTTSTTTTTVTPTITPMTERLGDLMGISAGAMASTRVLDACVDLGVRWVRVSHELGWNSLTGLQKTVTDAHARGLKVLQCIQKAGHTYTTNDAEPLTYFALQCAGLGIDALEIGNEWNHGPFFSPTTLPPTLQATLSAYIAPRVRAQYPTLPITTSGLSPAGGSYTPHLWWPAFWDAAPLANAGAGYTAQALHPFVYPEDPCGLIGHPEWNPWWALPIIRDAMTARGIHQPIWFTEVGCPGDPTGQTIIRGIVCDESRQQLVTSQYLKQWRTLGQPGEPIFIATAYDGDSVSVPGPENYLGLIRADGTRKPAWQIVHDTAALPL